MTVTAATTALVIAAAAFSTVRFVRAALLEAVQDAQATEIQAIRGVLEEQMLAGDRKALHRMVNEFGKNPDIHWIGIVAWNGRVRVSSDPA